MKNDQLLMLVLIAVLIIGGFSGWFKGSGGNTFITNNEILEDLNSEPTQTACSASFEKSVVNYGEVVSATLNDGSNTLCQIYARGIEPYSGWKQIYEATTNANGQISFSQNIYTSGVFEFRAICGTCITNPIQLTVNPAPAAGTCTDSDGKDNLKAGFVQTDAGYFYDDCAGNWAVTEYYCEGSAVKSQVMSCGAGKICFETRGGDYCKPTTPATTYHCCLAMGLKACYENGCPSAGIDLGTYSTQSDCLANCKNTEVAYTCGQSEWCPSGTCPTSYSCVEVESMTNRWCACVNDAGQVHQEWKVGGQYYYPRPI